MKAFLLAAGLGTRLRPITDTLPKCLVPIQGEALLGIWLRHCRQQGCTEVCVNLHAHASQVRAYLGSRDWGMGLRLVHENELLGSAGTLYANRSWVEGEKVFGIFYGDVLTNAALSPLLRAHREHAPAATLGLYEVPDPERCGIATLNPDGVISAFDEKPARPTGNLAFTGVMLAGPDFLQALPMQAPADIGGQVLTRLVGRMRGAKLPGFVLDIGTKANYELAQQRWPGLTA